MSLQDFLLNSLNLEGEPDIRSTLQYIVNTGVGSNGAYLRPLVDVVDHDEKLYVYVELPGVNKENISVDFFNNKITITGKKNKQYEMSPLKKEIIYGEFKRSVILPISVTKKENVKIEYNSGILKIIIDKKNEEENRFKLTLNEKSSLLSEIINSVE